MKQTITLLFLFALHFPIFSQGEGQYKNLNLQVNGLTRQYRLYIPPGHDGSEPWPLVFVFHGYGVSLDWQVGISQMYLVADTAKFLVAYPQGRTILDTFYNTSNTGWLVPGYKLVGAAYDDVEFVGKLIDDIDARPQYAVDLSRVFATGWSNGSEMSFYLACALADRIAAVAGVASQLSNAAMAACQPSRQMSILYIQGTDDVFVPPGGDAFYPPITDLPEYWAGYDNCNIVPDSTDLPNTVINDNSTVTFFDYSGCDNNHEVLFYRINEGGHNWPGGWLPPGFPHLLPINRDIHGSVVIWDFFNRNNHPDIASSVKTVATVNMIDVFPNPTPGEITLRLPPGFSISPDMSMTIFDLSGRAFFHAAFDKPEQRFDLGGLAAGMYWVEVRGGEKRVIQKVVLQK